jgi:hypothetical protein
MSIDTDEEALAAARELERLAEVERAAAARVGRYRNGVLTPRQAAWDAGLNRYIGKLCIHGHVAPGGVGSERYANNSKCVACARAKEAKSDHRRARKAMRRKAKARRLGWSKVR